MALQIRKAERRKAKLRLGLVGPSGSGKTYSALLLAKGLGGRIGLIDTEHGSGELYAHLADYEVIQLDPPFTIARYCEAIGLFEKEFNGNGTIILDSISHAWASEGGLLDKHGRLEASGKNSYMAWREVTPDHNRFIERMLQSPCHIIATLRAKQDYFIEKDKDGKSVPRKIGLAPVQREGMDYEFTLVLDIAADSHIAHASKDRTDLFVDWYDKVTPDTGKKLLEWLESGTDTPVPQPAVPSIAAIVMNTFPEAEQMISEEQALALSDMFAKYKELTGKDMLARSMAAWKITDLIDIKASDYQRRYEWILGEVEKASAH